MRNKKLIIFSAITIIVIVAASITAQLQAPQKIRSKDILFPDLASQINEISLIEIQGNNQLLILHKKNGIWVINNADDYPAIFEKIKETIINLSALKIISEKTDNPELYVKLGVEGPSGKNSKSHLLILKDNVNNEVTKLIVGLPRHSKSASNSPGLYVRKPDELNALLVEGSLDISDDTTDWFDQNILDVPSSHIQEIVIRHPDGDSVNIIKQHKQQTEFELLNNIDEKKSVFKIIFNRISTSLEELWAENVKTVKGFVFPEDAVVTTIKTFDGLVITIKCIMIDERPYAHFSFDSEDALSDTDSESGASDDTSKINTKEEAQILNNLMSEWIFEIPDFKYNDLTKRMESITGLMKPVTENGANESIKPLQNLDFP